jgi:hypothetical protein
MYRAEEGLGERKRRIGEANEVWDRRVASGQGIDETKSAKLIHSVRLERDWEDDTREFCQA